MDPQNKYVWLLSVLQDSEISSHILPGNEIKYEIGY